MNNIKRLVFEEYLPTNVLVYIEHPQLCRGIPFDRKEAGKIVPLEYGLNMPNPITGLLANDDGIYAVLSFNQNPVATFVPWEAVVSIFNPTTRFGSCWPSPTMRLFLMVEPLSQTTEKTPSETLANVSPAKPSLSLVK
jgi:hypothetical protein